MSDTEPRLPSGGPRSFPDSSDFSVGVITTSKNGPTALQRFLHIIHEGDGDRPAIVEGIRRAFLSNGAPEQQIKRAGNPLIALNENNYKLLAPGSLRLNDRGLAILRAATESDAVNLLARHIVHEVCGADLLRAVTAIKARSERPDKGTLAFELGLLGYSIGPTHTDATRMAGWLRKAGVLRDWEPDEARLFELAGVHLNDLEEWADLDQAQQAFLRTLRRLALVHDGRAVSVDLIRDEVETIHGASIWRRADNVPQDVIYPLADAKWLTRPSKTGRGARSGNTCALPRLLEVEIDILDRQLVSGLSSEVRSGLKLRLGDLLDDIDRNDGTSDQAGRALEILAARIAIELGLTGLILRDRSERTGGIEVDLIGEFIGRTYARWIIQCKNTKAKAGPEVLAREIGVAVVMHATVVVLVGVGGFSDRLKRLAAQVNARTPLQVILIDGDLLKRYRERGITVVVAKLKEQAARTAEVKRASTGQPVAT